MLVLIYIYIYIYIYVFIYLFIYIFICIYLFIYLFIHLSIDLCIYSLIYLFIYLSVCFGRSWKIFMEFDRCWYALVKKRPQRLSIYTVLGPRVKRLYMRKAVGNGVSKRDLGIETERC